MLSVKQITQIWASDVKWDDSTENLKPPHLQWSELITNLWVCFNKLVFWTSLKPAILLKERLWHKGFPVEFDKFLRTPFL